MAIECKTMKSLPRNTLSDSSLFNSPVPKSKLYGFGIVIAQTIRFLSILCPNLAGYSYIARNLRTEPRKIQLKAIEQTWTSYRETHCQELTEPFRKGSIYALLYHSCFARVANDRIADLQGQNNSQLTPDVTIQRLSKILSQANLSNSSGQRQWQTYQAQHCQFESLRSTEQAPQLVKQCRDRLAESRLRELEVTIRIR